MPPDASRTEATLELHDVSKFFGDLAALKGIRLRIAPGDSILLYGPNGSGKTTLLRTLAAVARPSEGRVLFGGQDLHQNPAAKAQIGLLTHATFLYGDLTVRENLKFVGTLFGLRELEKKIDAVLDLFTLRNRARDSVRELSRGLQQRVALARVFLHNPVFLLLDEPFTGLDAGAAENLTALLRRVMGEGTALVFSSHDFDQGAAIVRRLVALEGGSVRYDGPLSLAPLHSLRIGKSSRQ